MIDGRTDRQIDETENKAPFLKPIFSEGLIFAQSKARCLGRGIILGDIVGLQNACKATNSCGSLCSALGEELGLSSQSTSEVLGFWMVNVAWPQENLC